ncbi:MAG: Transposase [Candidatus Moranbacteria bacterium GW2011_GWC2_37_8]|nr:MAG: Transposase [Candidatus Moranbacteria bacterium GW2011_GWC2_37_8]KKQ63212.1 MAG: Transposase [Parcubacteria group bacterium GW2011_GWC1_38_22]
MKRREIIAVDEYYHIFNRGVEKRRIFYQKADYKRFVESLIFFNTDKPGWLVNDIREAGIAFEPEPAERLVDVVAYCVNSNHFHLILKENKEKGIATFMKKICTGYAMYFNKKNERSGILFQGRYKSVHMDSNDLLLYVSAYVNCNSEIHNIEKAQQYAWCSFSEYMNADGIICQKNIILDQFKNATEYKEFCFEKVVGMKKKKENENAIFEY